MNKLPRQKLIELIQEYGLSVADNPKRCKGLLLDYCGSDYRGEIKILIEALNEGVGSELRNISKGIPKPLIITQQTNKLIALHISDEAAQWAVETWALALGVITENELNSISESSCHSNAKSLASTQKPQVSLQTKSNCSDKQQISTKDLGKKAPSQHQKDTSSLNTRKSKINKITETKTISTTSTRNNHNNKKKLVWTLVITIVTVLGLGGIRNYYTQLDQSSAPSLALPSSAVISLSNPNTNYFKNRRILGLSLDIALTPDGKKLINYGKDNDVIKIWNLATGELLNTLEETSCKNILWYNQRLFFTDF